MQSKGPSDIDRRNCLLANEALLAWINSNSLTSLPDIKSKMEHTIVNCEIAMFSAPPYMLCEADDGHTLIITFGTPLKLLDVLKVDNNNRTGKVSFRIY